MSKVEVVIAGRKKSDYEKEAINMIQALLEHSGFYGEFSIVPERRCPGGSQYQGAAGIRISAARRSGDILLKIQLGDNGTCREYYLKLHVDEGMDRASAMKRLEEGRRLLVAECASRKAKKGDALQEDAVIVPGVPLPAGGGDAASQEQSRPDLKGLSQDPVLLKDLVCRLIEAVPSREMLSKGINIVFRAADPGLFRDGDEHVAGSITRALCNRGFLESAMMGGERAYRITDKAFEFSGIPISGAEQQSQSVPAQVSLDIPLDQLLGLGRQISEVQERLVELQGEREDVHKAANKRSEQARAEHAKRLEELKRQLEAELQAIATNRDAELSALDEEVARVEVFLASDLVDKFQQLKKMLVE